VAWLLSIRQGRLNHHRRHRRFVPILSIGYINSFSIAEQWMEEARAYVGTATVSASSVQLILQNRVAGRYTNNNSWQFYNSGDTSMNRVNYIANINYYFGKGAPATS
jgi:hypothetical protein